MMKTLDTQRIGFLGAGSIAEAMLSGICNKQLIEPARMAVTNYQDAERLLALQDRFGVRPCLTNPALIEVSDTIILAIKPKDAKDVCMGLRGLITREHLVISVVAGVSTSLIQSWLDVDCPIIRTMPNTSSAIGLSATGMTAGEHATEEHLALASEIFSSIGTVYIVPETEMDIITGLSGSGPAYVYYLVEAMVEAGTRAGLSAEMSRQLTLQTVLGAAHMLQHAEDPPAVLRRKVTSPGGTTQAGLEVLESYRFQEGMVAAILRAAERAREMGQEHENAPTT